MWSDGKFHKPVSKSGAQSEWNPYYGIFRVHRLSTILSNKYIVKRNHNTIVGSKMTIGEQCIVANYKKNTKQAQVGFPKKKQKI